MTQADVAQVCYATRDIEATARSLAALEGVGPFFVAEFSLHDLVYRGKRVEYGPIQVAFGYSGDLQYELIEPLQGDGGFFEELLDGRREAFHHTYQSTCEDYDAVIARYAANGESVAYCGVAGEDVRFAFIDATARLGHFIELLETARMQDDGSAAILRAYDRMREAAQGWDGDRPIRPLAELFDG